MPIPLQTDAKYPVEFVAMWGSSARGCRSTRDWAAPGSTLTQARLQLTLKPSATGVGADASETQAAFSYYLPPLIPAGMQDAASYVLLLKGKLASPLPNNSEEMSYFSRYQIKGGLPLHGANVSLGCHVAGAHVLSHWLACTKNLKAYQQAKK